ncbi:MAG: hypothetical protein ABSB78_08685 [Bacteroidota bacterium]
MVHLDNLSLSYDILATACLSRSTTVVLMVSIVDTTDFFIAMALRALSVVPPPT